jgi:protease I
VQTNIEGKKIAILATDGFEQSELFEPKQALEDAGAHVEIISIYRPQADGGIAGGSEDIGDIKGWNHTDWGDSIRVDRPVAQARPEGYDALVLPGGVMNPDKLRQDPAAVSFVKAFVESGKPVAAICHGPWTLIEAGVVNGKTITSWPSLKTDLTNAGAHWVDEEVHVDGNLVTSRNPGDIPAFNGALIGLIQTYESHQPESSATDLSQAVEQEQAKSRAARRSKKEEQAA